MSGMRTIGLGLALALGTGLAVAPSRRVAADDGEVSRPRYNLTPSYHPGDRFRVVRDYRQRTITAESSRRGGLPFPGGGGQPGGPSPVGPRPGGLGFAGPVDPSLYDAMLHVEAAVTINDVSPAGDAEVWTARIESFRYDLPDPLQNSEYRQRRRERKAKNLPVDSHPLEGSIIKVDESGPKTRVFRETESGKDYAITTRYPEVLPLMQELVDPDWIPVDTIPIGGQWEMNADHLFRFSRVLMRTPLKGIIQCSLANVAKDIATIDFRAKLLNEYAKVHMLIVVGGTMTFDLGHRRPASTSYSGEVQISSPGSSLVGIGHIDGGTAFIPIDTETFAPGGTK